jgi:hypothetical protein
MVIPGKSTGRLVKISRGYVGVSTAIPLGLSRGLTGYPGCGYWLTEQPIRRFNSLSTFNTFVLRIFLR